MPHIIIKLCDWICGPGSSVGIATGYGLDGPGIESRWGRDFPDLSRPALGPTQPPVQWVPGFFPRVNCGRGVTLTPHTLLVPWSRKSRSIPLLPLSAVRPVHSLSACTSVHLYLLTLRQDLVPLNITCQKKWNCKIHCIAVHEVTKGKHRYSPTLSLTSALDVVGG